MEGLKDPVKIGKELYKTYRSYIRDNMQLNDVYQEERDELYKEGSSASLMQSPVIELTPTYESSKTVSEEYSNNTEMEKFFNEGLFAEDSKKGRKPRQLYTHQIKAIESFRNDKNLIVTTGTGSGKTECFLMPVTESLVKEA